MPAPTLPQRLTGRLAEAADVRTGYDTHPVGVRSKLAPIVDELVAACGSLTSCRTSGFA